MVVERSGLFPCLYEDKGSHFSVYLQQVTQFLPSAVRVLANNFCSLALCPVRRTVVEAAQENWHPLCDSVFSSHARSVN